MNQETVNLQIPFESLVDAIASLGLQEKCKLWQLLDEQISETEDDLLEEDPLSEGKLRKREPHIKLETTSP